MPPLAVQYISSPISDGVQTHMGLSAFVIPTPDCQRPFHASDCHLVQAVPMAHPFLVQQYHQYQPDHSQQPAQYHQLPPHSLPVVQVTTPQSPFPLTEAVQPVPPTCIATDHRQHAGHSFAYAVDHSLQPAQPIGHSFVPSLALTPHMPMQVHSPLQPPGDNTERAIPRPIPTNFSEALLVRTHNPTEAGMNRILTWAQDCMQNGIGFFVSVDVTRATGMQAMIMLSHTLPNGHVHGYTESDMVDTYPALKREIPELLRTTCNVTENVTLAWGMHCEALGLWARATKIAHGAQNVWVTEDDVGYTGNISSLIHSYKASEADLITDGHWRAWCDVKPWYWRRVASMAFRMMVPRAERVYCREHIQRLSSRLIDEIDKMAACGVSAWSEMATISLCKAKGMRLEKFRDGDVGEVFTWNGRVTEQQWQIISSTPEKQGKLYHALKW